MKRICKKVIKHCKNKKKLLTIKTKKMIKLNLGIGEGDVKIYNFKNIAKLCKFISEFKKYDCIWVFAEDGDGEIIITKSIDNIIKTIKANIFNNMEFFMQEYQTYEDAYAVALNMKEINPKCYN